MYVLDTDILIDVLRGHQPAINWFTALRQVPSIPGFVVMELIQNRSYGEGSTNFHLNHQKRFLIGSRWAMPTLQ